ncbi:hypothetical protein [Nitrobacter sp. JJSN]|uniref:hypothetical protein n=1 Tax=Nitrobacter sp. JJSN TaxID=3453033 RepID=UPI003F76A19B
MTDELADLFLAAIESFPDTHRHAGEIWFERARAAIEALSELGVDVFEDVAPTNK